MLRDQAKDGVTMFKKVKMVTEKDEWVLEIANREIPVSAIRAFFNAMLTALIAFLAYNIGQLDATIYFQYIQSAIHTGCQPIISGNTINWNCTANTTNKNNASVIPVWQS